MHTSEALKQLQTIPNILPQFQFHPSFPQKNHYIDEPFLIWWWLTFPYPRREEEAPLLHPSAWNLYPRCTGTARSRAWSSIVPPSCTECPQGVLCDNPLTLWMLHHSLALLRSQVWKWVLTSDSVDTFPFKLPNFSRWFQYNMFRFCFAHPIPSPQKIVVSCFVSKKSGLKYSWHSAKVLRHTFTTLLQFSEWSQSCWVWSWAPLGPGIWSAWWRRRTVPWPSYQAHGCRLWLWRPVTMTVMNDNNTNTGLMMLKGWRRDGSNGWHRKSS